MGPFRLVLTTFLITLLLSISVAAQDDETREASGLPMKIGANVANTGRAALSGKIVIRGLDESKPKPFIYVLIYVSGIVLERKPTTESGNYFFPSIPREGVTIVIEVNGNEVGRQQLLPSTLGSIRQDFDVLIPQGMDLSEKPGIVSAKNLYDRNSANEKLYLKAIAALKVKKPKEAEKLLLQIVSSDPLDFISWSELGTIYFNDSNAAEAEKAYNKARELKPEYSPVLLNLGRLYISGKLPGKAIEILSKAVELEPNSADAHHLLGEAFLSDRKGSKAVLELNEAIRLAPIEKAEIHIRLAALYNAAGLKDKASEEYKKLLEKQPSHPEKAKFEKYIAENSTK